MYRSSIFTVQGIPWASVDTAMHITLLKAIGPSPRKATLMQIKYSVNGQAGAAFFHSAMSSCWWPQWVAGFLFTRISVLIHEKNEEAFMRLTGNQSCIGLTGRPNAIHLTTFHAILQSRLDAGVVSGPFVSAELRALGTSIPTGFSA